MEELDHISNVLMILLLPILISCLYFVLAELVGTSRSGFCVLHLYIVILKNCLGSSFHLDRSSGIFLHHQRYHELFNFRHIMGPKLLIHHTIAQLWHLVMPPPLYMTLSKGIVPISITQHGCQCFVKSFSSMLVIFGLGFM